MSQNRTPGSGPHPDDYAAIDALFASGDDAPEPGDAPEPDDHERDEEGDGAMRARVLANLGIADSSALTSSIDAEYAELTAHQQVGTRLASATSTETTGARYEFVIGEDAERTAGYTGDDHLELEVVLHLLEPGITRVEATAWVPRPPGRDLLAAIVFTDPVHIVRFPLRLLVADVDGEVVHELSGRAIVPTPGTLAHATIES